MQDFKSITTQLKRRGIPHEEIHFTDSAVAARASDTSKDHNFDPKSAIKALVITSTGGNKCLVLRGDDVIDDAKLKSVSGKWTIVPKATLERELGLIAGGVCPLTVDLPILVDRRVKELDLLSMGAGDVTKGINVRKDDFWRNIGEHDLIDVAEEGFKKLTVQPVEQQKKVDLIVSNLNEIIGEDDLRRLIATGTPLRHYIGFEISGLVHLGTGLLTMLKIRDLQQAGVSCRVFLADWHTWINNKLGGDHEFIKKVADEYFRPALEAGAAIVGADPGKIEFISGSDLYHNNDKFWQTVIEVSKNVTLSRVLKSTSIMGRDERNSQPFAWLVYPPMQIADIFTLGVNIAHAGTDQRKVHVIAREVALNLKVQHLEDAEGKKIKPVAIHHDLLLGLQAPSTWPVPEGAEKDTIRSQMKMSKSIPGSAIFIHDSEDEIREKVRKAFCPEREVELNPVVNWVRHLVLPLRGKLEINREKRFGGRLTIGNAQELDSLFGSVSLHPMDLKNAVSDFLVDILAPARKRFGNKKSQDLISLIRDKQKKK